MNGKLRCYSIYEDSVTKAFLTIRPVSEGHTLVIPKKHFETIFDISQEELSHLIGVTKLLCLHYRQKAEVESLNLVLSNGEATNQKNNALSLTHYPQKSERWNLVFPRGKMKNRLQSWSKLGISLQPNLDSKKFYENNL